MSFHVKDNFQPGAPISQVPASWFNAVARLLNGLVGGNGITVVKNDFGPSVISLDNNEDASRYVTLSTSQTITGAKVFTSSTTYDTSADATYGYLHFNFRGTLAGRITTSASTVRLRAYNGTAYSGIQLDHAGTDGAQRQLLENEPLEDATSNSSTQIASRGWANKYFLRKSDYSAPDLSNYVTITGAQTITGAKTFQSANLDQLAGVNYSRYRFLDSSTGSTIIAAEIIANLYNHALHLRVHNGNGYGGIVVASNNGGFAQQLISEPSADTTATTSTQIASRGWTNGHFIRKSETATGFVFNNAGAVSYRDFGTTADTVAAGNHTHDDYVTYDDLGDAFMEAIEDAQSSFLDDLVAALEAEFTNYVTISGSQTITGAKVFTSSTTYDTSASATYGYLHFNFRGTLAGRIITAQNTVHLRAYKGTAYSGVQFDFGGTDGAQRQLLENEPSHDAGWLNTSNTQIATRGFVYAKYATKGHTHTLGDITVSSTAQSAVIFGLIDNRLYIDTTRSSILAASATTGATKFLTDKDTKANGGTLLTTDDLDTTKVLTTDDLDTNGGTLLTTDDLDTNGGTIMTTTAGTKFTGNIIAATDIQWTGSVLKYTPVTQVFSNGLCMSATPGSVVTIDTPTVITWS